LETTGSAAKTGISGFAAALPFIVAGIFGGTVVDRMGYRQASIVSDLASAVPVALIPLLHLTVGLQFWQLLVLVFLAGLLDTPGNTARTALLPDLAKLAGMPLERVNALQQMIERGALLIGAPLTGVIIAVTDVTTALLLDAASFLVSAAIIALLIPRVEMTSKAEAPGAPPSRYLDDLWAGFRYIRADRLVLPLVVMIGIMNFLDAIVGLIWPVYADRVYGQAVDLGVMMAAMGGGAVVTTILYAAFGHRLPRRGTFIIAFIVAGLPLFVLALTPGIAFAAAVLLFRGFGAGPLNPILITVGHERIPAEMRGRVFGVITSLAWVSIPAGRLLAGYLIEGIGLIPTLTATAIAYVGVTMSMFLIPAFKEMDRPALMRDMQVPGEPLRAVAGERN
ncbi:MAG: MFS transporter, partial [Chloroflexota bacterium]|nr:MFS transporter [Chloroflexota bacterium]